jgi:hypothetical protein
MDIAVLRAPARTLPAIEMEVVLTTDRVDQRVKGGLLC